MLGISHLSLRSEPSLKNCFSLSTVAMAPNERMISNGFDDR